MTDLAASEIVEAVARAISGVSGIQATAPGVLAVTQAAIAAARPLILEEAAKVAEDTTALLTVADVRGDHAVDVTKVAIAQAIRALGKDGG